MRRNLSLRSLSSRSHSATSCSGRSQMGCRAVASQHNQHTQRGPHTHVGAWKWWRYVYILPASAIAMDVQIRANPSWHVCSSVLMQAAALSCLPFDSSRPPHWAKLVIATIATTVSNYTPQSVNNRTRCHEDVKIDSLDYLCCGFFLCCYSIEHNELSSRGASRTIRRVRSG